MCKSEAPFTPRPSNIDSPSAWQPSPPSTSRPRRSPAIICAAVDDIPLSRRRCKSRMRLHTNPKQIRDTDALNKHEGGSALARKFRRLRWHGIMQRPSTHATAETARNGITAYVHSFRPAALSQTRKVDPNTRFLIPSAYLIFDIRSDDPDSRERGRSLFRCVVAQPTIVLERACNGTQTGVCARGCVCC